MKTVLGIDAAWTLKNPSGVALVQQSATGWSLIAVSPSVPQFLELAPPTKESGDAARLVQACAHLSGVAPQIVAIDMPLARRPITKRRASDNAISSAYGSRKCSTHSPTPERPGLIGERWYADFEKEGYPLQTSKFVGRGIVEVYPHPALVELAQAPERLRYKVAKKRSYWKECSPSERNEKLRAVWEEIIDLLDKVVAGTRTGMEPLMKSGKPKAIEDALDAVVCAWVGTCILDGLATPFGDEESAIWVPNPS